MQIKIDHIAKIEGHAGFTANIVGGNVSQVKLDVQEGARLLEGILRGRSIYEVSQISARICGVCPVVHALTSLKALERALGVEVSEQTVLLRKLMMLGQIINSHALHLFFFSLSDFFGFKNDLALIKKFPHRAKDALAIRAFGNRLIEVIGGRAIHPLTPTIGGFLKLPDVKNLGRLFHRSDDVLAAAKRMADLFINLKYPDFVRSAPYVSLHMNHEYAIYDGAVKTPSEREATPAEFLKIVNEYQLTGSTAKRSFYHGKPFMVGALSRLNHNRAQLNPEAKRMLKASKIHLPSLNSLHNILAQAIEIVHCVEESRKLLRRALIKNFKAENVSFTPKAGRGTAAIEAPRGTLYYYYEVNAAGLIENCNIVTPTAQNLARLEEDMKEYIPSLIDSKKDIPKKDCADKIKMLVRAYDPCLTCSTH